jgi:hypothetical protein
MKAFVDGGSRALENARAPTEWELKLAALQRNDAAVTSVDVERSTVKIPKGYFRSLGSALQLNTTVTYMCLDTSLLEEDESNDTEVGGHLCSTTWLPVGPCRRYAWNRV